MFVSFFDMDTLSQYLFLHFAKQTTQLDIPEFALITPPTHTHTKSSVTNVNKLFGESKSSCKLLLLLTLEGVSQREHRDLSVDTIQEQCQ